MSDYFYVCSKMVSETKDPLGLILYYVWMRVKILIFFFTSFILRVGLPILTPFLRI